VLARRSFAQTLSAPGSIAPRLRGGKIAKYLGENFATVKSPRGQMTVLQSSLPLRAEDGSGDAAPVDLTLEQTQGHLAPKNPLVPVTFPMEAAGAARLTTANVGLSPRAKDVSDAEPIVDRGQAFYRLGSSVDYLLTATPSGLEAFWQLRSASSPEELALDVDVPPGARLRETPAADGIAAGPRPGSIDVVRDNKVIARVLSPSAMDADHEPVNVTMKAVRDQLRLKVLHRKRDLRYPLLVDPVVEDYLKWTNLGGVGQAGTNPGPNDWLDPNSWMDPRPQQQDAAAGYNNWTYDRGTSGAGPQFRCYYSSANPGGSGQPTNPNCAGVEAAYGPMPYGKGLYLWGNQGAAYAQAQWQQWKFTAPGDARIFRVDFGWVYHRDTSSAASGPGSTLAQEGVYSARSNRWETQCVNYPGATCANTTPFQTTAALSQDFRTHCSRDGAAAGHTGCWPGPASAQVGSPGNIAVLNQHMSWGGTPSAAPYLFMGGAQVMMHEYNLPTVSVSHTGLPTGWTRDASMSTQVTANDSGLGVKRLLLSAPGFSRTIVTDACSGTRQKGTPCPASKTASTAYAAAELPEGSNTIKALADDIVLNRGGSSTWNVKVDRSGPALPAVTGDLYERRNRTDDHRYEGIYDDQATIHVEAQDGSGASAASQRSGVKTLELSIDDMTVATSSDLCLSGQCDYDRSLDYTLLSDLYSEGDHNLKLVAKDLAGNETVREWTVTVDREGDIYAAQFRDGPESVADTLVSSEWLKFGTYNGRAEGPDDLLTRRTEPCPDDSASQCDVVRERTYFTDDQTPGSTSPDAWNTTIGAADDPDLKNILELRVADELTGDPAAQGNLLAAALPWQTLPPAHGTDYVRYDVPGTRLVTDPPDESSAEGGAAGPTESLEPTTQQVFLDAETRLPIKISYRAADNSVLEESYWTYQRNRRNGSEYPANYFAADEPTSTAGPRTETREYGSAGPGLVLDRETQSSFVPWSLGSALDQAAMGPMCRAQSLVINHRRPQSPAAVGEIQGADPGIEPALRTNGIETTAQNSYVRAGSLANCAASVEAAGGKDWDLDVISMDRTSTNAQTWRQAFGEDAQAATVAVDNDDDPFRSGLAGLTLGGVAETAFMVPADDGNGVSVLLDLGDTTTVLTGEFAEPDLQGIIDSLGNN